MKPRSKSARSSPKDPNRHCLPYKCHGALGEQDTVVSGYSTCQHWANQLNELSHIQKQFSGKITPRTSASSPSELTSAPIAPFFSSQLSQGNPTRCAQHDGTTGPSGRADTYHRQLRTRSPDTDTIAILGMGERVQKGDYAISTATSQRPALFILRVSSLQLSGKTNIIPYHLRPRTHLSQSSAGAAEAHSRGQSQPQRTYHFSDCPLQ